MELFQGYVEIAQKNNFLKKYFKNKKRNKTETIHMESHTLGKINQNFGNNNLYKVDHEKGRATLIAEGVQEINRSFVWNDVALLKNLPKECGENQAVRVDEKCLESIRKVVDIVKRKQSLENKLENNIEQAKARYAQTSPSLTLASANHTNIDR